jgi:hypothetical protein
VGTCPKTFWTQWIAEGDAAGDAESGKEWGWYTEDRRALLAEPGDRFYVVAHGKLRGWAPIVAVRRPHMRRESVICRRGGAVAVTLAAPIPGFRGLRKRWWQREEELPFPDWRTP